MYKNPAGATDLSLSLSLYMPPWPILELLRLSSSKIERFSVVADLRVGARSGEFTGAVAPPDRIIMAHQAETAPFARDGLHAHDACAFQPADAVPYRPAVSILPGQFCLHRSRPGAIA